MSVSFQHGIKCPKFCLSHTVSNCLWHNLFIMYTQQCRPNRNPTHGSTQHRDNSGVYIIHVLTHTFNLLLLYIDRRLGITI